MSEKQGCLQSFSLPSFDGSSSVVGNLQSIYSRAKEGGRPVERACRLNVNGGRGFDVEKYTLSTNLRQKDSKTTDVVY